MEEVRSPNRLPAANESLWFLIASPTIWAVHFLLCYLTAAIWCAKVAGPGGSLAPVRVAILFYTAAALIGVGIVGWIGYRRHGLGSADLPHDDDSPEDRHRFLGFATALLSALTGVAIVYETLAALFIDRCY
jgi:hypothetical protein